MRNFQDNFETRKRSFISAFLICMTVPLNKHLNYHNSQTTVQPRICPQKNTHKERRIYKHERQKHVKIPNSYQKYIWDIYNNKL